MTPQQILDYYASLLILQYLGKPRAYATIRALCGAALLPQTTVEAIAFSGVAASGTFILNYGTLPTATINWNDSAAAIQTKLQAVSGLGSVTVSGSVSSQSLVVTFTGVPPIASLLTVTSNSLVDGSANAISLTVTETDVTLPFAVLNGFNLNGSSPAIGAQLNTLGKYAGVTRYGATALGPITLDDADFLSLIQFAIVKNSSGSSLATIQALLHQYFPNEVFVFDTQNMQMSYLISSSVGSQNLVNILVSEGLLPKPMAVELATVVYAPTVNKFFGFRTYDINTPNNSPFNTYDDYVSGTPWLTYSDGITV